MTLEEPAKETWRDRMAVILFDYYNDHISALTMDEVLDEISNLLKQQRETCAKAVESHFNICINDDVEMIKSIILNAEIEVIE